MLVLLQRLRQSFRSRQHALRGSWDTGRLRNEAFMLGPKPVQEVVCGDLVRSVGLREVVILVGRHLECWLAVMGKRDKEGPHPSDAKVMNRKSDGEL